MRTKVFLLSSALLLVAPVASAQDPVSIPGSWPLAFNPVFAPRPLFGAEPTGHRGDLAPYALSTPLRLSLGGGIFPMGSMLPQCASREDGSGNSIQGFAVQRYTFLELAPQLVLSGFSTTGCPIDSAVGGMLTYAVPLRPDTWLVAGAGFYGAPPRDGLPTREQGDVSLDLVQKRKDGSSLSLGVDLSGVRFGSSW
jgi:hypothetical protein